MKKMTCRQLGGACDIEFEADTFEEMAEKSKLHGQKMYKAGDKKHIDAMNEMMNLMQDEEAMTKWFNDRKREFEEL